MNFLHNLRGASSKSFDLDACVVCHISEGSATNPLQNVKKGLENLVKFCKKFNQTGLEEHLERQEQLCENYRKIKLHKNCQRYVYNQNKKRTATIALLIVEKNNRNNCLKVTTLHLEEKVLLSCQKRDDQISKEVALRVRSRNDLVSVQAHYHTSGRITFKNPEKNIPSWGKNAKKLTSLPVENETLLHFDQLCEWIEQEVECYTVKELHQKMIEIADFPLFTQQNG